MPALEAGRKRAKQIIEDLTSGNAHVGNFTARQTAVTNDAVGILRPTGVSLTEAARQFAEAHRLLEGCGGLSEAVRCFLEEHKRTQLSPIKLPDLVEKFMVHLRGQEKSRRYTLDMQARLHKAAQTFNGFVGDIHATDINRWLVGMRHLLDRKHFPAPALTIHFEVGFMRTSPGPSRFPTPREQ